MGHVEANSIFSRANPQDSTEACKNEVLPVDKLKNSAACITLLPLGKWVGIVAFNCPRIHDAHSSVEIGTL